jgi:hypothetical protein
MQATVGAAGNIDKSIITFRTRMDDDNNDRGKAIDTGGGACAISNAVTMTTQCALCVKEKSANRRRNGRKNDVRCGGGIGGDATMASTSQGKEGNDTKPE